MHQRAGRSAGAHRRGAVGRGLGSSNLGLGGKSALGLRSFREEVRTGCVSLSWRKTRFSFRTPQCNGTRARNFVWSVAENNSGAQVVGRMDQALEYTDSAVRSKSMLPVLPIMQAVVRGAHTQPNRLARPPARPPLSLNSNPQTRSRPLAGSGVASPLPALM